MNPKSVALSNIVLKWMLTFERLEYVDKKYIKFITSGQRFLKIHMIQHFNLEN